MSGRLNWGKVENERKLNYRPSQRSRPASLAQINFIKGLAVQKGQPPPKIPKSMRGASELIEQLLKLPDVTERIAFEPVAVAPVFSARKEMVLELTEVFPSLTPMTVNSLIQLAEAMYEPLELAFIVSEIAEDAQFAPEGLSDLVSWLLRRFLAFSGD